MKIITTGAEYKRALKRAMSTFQADSGTSESSELKLLLWLIKGYEDEHIILPEGESKDVVAKFLLGKARDKADAIWDKMTIPMRNYSKYWIRNNVCLAFSIILDKKFKTLLA